MRSPFLAISGGFDDRQLPAGATDDMLGGDAGQGVEAFGQISKAQIFVCFPDPVAGGLGDVAEAPLTFAQRRLGLLAFAEFALYLLSVVQDPAVQHPGPDEGNHHNQGHGQRDPEAERLRFGKSAGRADGRGGVCGGHFLARMADNATGRRDDEQHEQRQRATPHSPPWAC